ncbi:MAG: hypothetical protein GTN86_06600 [Xanthomonadales bacterium]|nr:hypothetical protein [Xanthomonadales bacterium]NIN60559.1 hypothetical protein [Xanthomonadales bacterium]NIN75911.1 hypothetical protein [Xanthomonadales bacterium]NIO15003.1 hypothetical protein [Xanthomonadales bacterium]NIP12952.1 hypothetical protein [Xanthomonadales bacterium]
MLKSIFMVTIVVLNAEQAEQDYRQHLGYETVGKGALSTGLASAWGLPAMAGAAYVLMQAKAPSPNLLRFIEAAEPGNYQPLRTQGWNAVEILVEDAEALARSLAPSPFEVIGPPRFLTEQRNIKALQALGPAGELLYLTQVLDPTQTSFRIGSAQAWVDRVFIMVLGTTDLAATTRFYTGVLAQEISGPWPYRIGVLSRAWDQPEDRVYPLSVVQLQGQYLVEIDEYPPEAARRDRPAGGLPFGPAMVTFEVGSLAEAAERLAMRPGAVPDPPYAGRELLVVEGPSGEWLELIGPEPVAAGDQTP